MNREAPGQDFFFLSWHYWTSVIQLLEFTEYRRTVYFKIQVIAYLKIGGVEVLYEELHLLGCDV
jgi:hypothetical protein